MKLAFQSDTSSYLLITSEESILMGTTSGWKDAALKRPDGTLKEAQHPEVCQRDRRGRLLPSVCRSPSSKAKQTALPASIHESPIIYAVGSEGKQSVWAPYTTPQPENESSALARKAFHWAASSKHFGWNECL